MMNNSPESPVLHAEQIHRIQSFRLQGERVIARAYLNAIGEGKGRGIPHGERICCDEASALIRNYVSSLGTNLGEIEKFYDDLLAVTDAALMGEYRLLRESGLSWYRIWTLTETFNPWRLGAFLSAYRHRPASKPQTPAAHLLESYLND